MGAAGAEIIAAKIAGEPKWVRQGLPVKVTGLVASPWSMSDRSGVSFRAARIEPLAASGQKAS